ncbi:hypothetical protein EPI10_001515 [Gossypium australe]|uniref:Uncharacterized protein n=1 Tax=Gossypium australe TaxID=47621 RepID=A0A5B6VBB5_9ROSI|nr:hypothetical protein EPI10_001515 [Gossypium australe]
MSSISNRANFNEVESFIPATDEGSTRNESGLQGPGDMAPNVFLRMMRNMYEAYLKVNSTAQQTCSLHPQSSTQQNVPRITIDKVRKCGAIEFCGDVGLFAMYGVIAKKIGILVVVHVNVNGTEGKTQLGFL